MSSQYSYREGMWTEVDFEPTFDVRQNNYLLPMPYERFEISPTTRARMNLAARWADTPKYEESLWAVVEFFGELQTSRMRDHMRTMGIKGVSENRRELILRCSNWWIKHLDSLTKPILRSGF